MYLTISDKYGIRKNLSPMVEGPAVSNSMHKVCNGKQQQYLKIILLAGELVADFPAVFFHIFSFDICYGTQTDKYKYKIMKISEENI